MKRLLLVGSAVALLLIGNAAAAADAPAPTQTPTATQPSVPAQPPQKFVPFVMDEAHYNQLMAYYGQRPFNEAVSPMMFFSQMEADAQAKAAAKK